MAFWESIGLFRSQLSVVGKNSLAISPRTSIKLYKISTKNLCINLPKVTITEISWKFHQNPSHTKKIPRVVLTLREILNFSKPADNWQSPEHFRRFHQEAGKNSTVNIPGISYGCPKNTFSFIVKLTLQKLMAALENSCMPSNQTLQFLFA